jgi:hypothetical protein
MSGMIPTLTDADKERVHRLIETVAAGDSDRMDTKLECGARASAYAVGKVVRVDIFNRS